MKPMGQSARFLNYNGGSYSEQAENTLARIAVLWPREFVFALQASKTPVFLAILGIATSQKALGIDIRNTQDGAGTAQSNE